MQNLSGGELQRVAITLCLGKPADVYLIDEPSAYLDSEQRLHAAKVIKRFVTYRTNVCDKFYPKDIALLFPSKDDKDQANEYRTEILQYMAK